MIVIDAALAWARDHWPIVALLSFAAGAAAMFFFILSLDAVAEWADGLRKQIYWD